jgi:hypothetical protein
MKKIVWVLGGLLLLALILPVAAKPAVVVTDEGCNFWTDYGHVTASSIQVFTMNENEIGMISCKGVLPYPPLFPKEAVVNKKVICGYVNTETGMFYFTQDARMVITPGGQVSVTCNFVPPLSSIPS